MTFFKVVSEGERNFRAIAVVGDIVLGGRTCEASSPTCPPPPPPPKDFEMVLSGGNGVKDI